MLYPSELQAHETKLDGAHRLAHERPLRGGEFTPAISDLPARASSSIELSLHRQSALFKRVVVGQFAVAALYERRNLLNQKPAVASFVSAGSDRRYRRTRVHHYPSASTPTGSSWPRRFGANGSLRVFGKAFASRKVQPTSPATCQGDEKRAWRSPEKSP